MAKTAKTGDSGTFKRNNTPATYSRSRGAGQGFDIVPVEPMVLRDRVAAHQERHPNDLNRPRAVPDKRHTRTTRMDAHERHLRQHYSTHRYVPGDGYTLGRWVPVNQE
jgi:hypothetical protein